MPRHRTDALLRALQHPRRVEVHDYVCETREPIPMPAVATALNMTTAAASYHVQALTDAGAAVWVDHEGRVRRSDQ